MKATLEYDLNDADEARAHLRAVKSLDMALVLFEMTANVRRKVENSLESGVSRTDSSDALDMVFEELTALLEEHGVVINDLIV